MSHRETIKRLYIPEILGIPDVNTVYFVSVRKLLKRSATIALREMGNKKGSDSCAKHLVHEWNKELKKY